MRLIRNAGILALVGVLAACAQEEILPGERFDLRAPFDETAGIEPENRSLPVALPQQVTNNDWTHRLGAASNRPVHPALPAALELAWSAQIGQGESRRHRITATPVAAEGRIFTLDSRTTVTATSAAGQTLWQRDLTPSFAARSNASGGGLALGAGKLFVTTGQAQLVALDPASGAELWRQRFDAPLMGAPMISGNRVYAVATDSSGWVLDVEDGRILRSITGAASTGRMVGGASPAMAGGLVLFPFPSGELVAARPDSGLRIWTTTIAGRRLGQAYGFVTDITGDPVVAGNRVFVGNQSGRVMALDATDGRRVWTATEAAYGPVWPVGDALFMMTDRNRLLRLDARNGDRVWAVELPLFTRDRERRRAEIFAHYGPVLAGGRLIVASNDGLMRSFDPASGALLSEAALPRGAATAPIVVGGTLYVVTVDGRLHAFR